MKTFFQYLSWFCCTVVALVVVCGLVWVMYDCVLNTKGQSKVVAPRNISQELYQMHDQQVKGLFLGELIRLEQRIEYLEAKVK